MIDWTAVTDAADNARTLSPEALKAYLDSLSMGADAEQRVRALMARGTAPAGFMATSVDSAPADEPTLAPGTRVGVWRVGLRLGAGGMGEVYRAERADGLYEQTVALKLMRSDDQRRSERFQRERQRLASLEHPSISRIIDGGVADDGRPYLTMELVDGQPIDRFVAERSLDRARTLALFAELCDAVDYAHRQLVLHRDIKADNVLVDGDGQIRLIDFGIASEIGDDEMGGPLTIATAAPEQLLGEPLSIGTDVHALGVLLHQLLLDVLPSRRADGSMVAAPVADADLQAIVERSLAFDAGQRYPSAGALGDDVRAFLQHRPVAARGGGGGYRARLFVRRYPWASGLAAALLLALTAGLVTSLRFANLANAQAERATAALARLQDELGRSEANVKAQEAYSDVLQRAFGGDEDAERLTELMLTRWREAMALREDDPLRAASLSYAVGRNFFFRGDTRNAITVLDPWMTERFGPTPLVELGEEMYALLLEAVDRDDEAEALLRMLLARFDERYPDDRADIFNYAFKLARITRDPADIDRAEALVLELIANDVDPFERLFHHNQLGFLRLARGDRAGAYEAYRVTVSIFDANPNLAAYGRDVARFNLAGQELGYRRDLDAAERLVQALLTEDVELKGESAQQGRGLLLQALIDSERGRHAPALSGIERAVQLLERYSGTGTSAHLSGLMSAAIVAAAAGDVPRNEQRLAELQRLTASLPPDDDRLVSVAMADVVSAAFLGERDADATQRLASEPLLSRIQSSAMHYYFARLLAERGAVDAEALGLL